MKRLMIGCDGVVFVISWILFFLGYFVGLFTYSGGWRFIAALVGDVLLFPVLVVKLMDCVG